MPLHMIRDDISKVKADAIVNPANHRLLEGSGTSRAIFLAAGEEQLQQACAQIGHCTVGNAVITPGFGLKSKYIIHAVGPRWKDGTHGEEELLFHTYQSALQLAKEHNMKSVAFPLLSAGNYGFPKHRALKLAMASIAGFLETNEMDVYLVLYENKAVRLGKELREDLKEYIDDHYVEENNEELGDECIRREYEETSYSLADEMPPLCSISSLPVPRHANVGKKRSLEELMGQMDETFSQKLLRLIDEKGYTDIQAYKRANISRKLFSKIRSDVNYNPSKRTAIAFCIALKLNLDETKDLLKTAGYALSNSSKGDIIIEYFIEKQVYDIFKINEVLFSYEQQVLG